MTRHKDAVVGYANLLAQMPDAELVARVRNLVRLLSPWGRKLLLPYWRAEFRRRKSRP